MRRRFDIGGRALGIPYDWRWPSVTKIARRLWIPGGPWLVPKVFGWGWTLNFAHRATWITLAATVVVALGVALVA